MSRGGVRVSGAASARARVREASRRAANRAPALQEIPPILERHVQQTFSTQGASTGNSWKPLSKPYAGRKSREGGRMPLVLSGSLRDSFFGGQWHVIEAGAKSLTWGTRHPLAHLHQRGTKGKRVPARPVVVVTAELRQRVRDQLSEWITDEE